MKKRMAAWMLICCLLFSLPCAQAITLEKAALEAMPQLLVQALDGFALRYEDEAGAHGLVLAQDPQGQPALLWGAADEELPDLTGVRLETAIEAFFCHLFGVTELPEGSAVDLGFLADIASNLAAAASASITVTEQATVKEDGNTWTQLDAVFSPKKLLTEADRVMHAQLAAHAEQIDAFFTRYAVLVSQAFPGSEGLHSAAALLDEWKELQVSTLLPIDIPVQLQLETTGTLSDPWHAEASCAGVRLTADFSGSHLTAELKTWQNTYAFDSRDLHRLWIILQDAWTSVSDSSFSLSLTDDQFSFRFHPRALQLELKTGLAQSLQLHADDAQELWTRYAPWFGLDAQEMDSLIDNLPQQLNRLFNRLNRYVPLADVDVQASLGDESLVLEASVNGVTARFSLSESAVSLLFPTANGFLSLSGSFGSDAFLLTGMMDSDRFSVTGRLENGRWLIDIFGQDELVATAMMTGSTLQVISAEASELIFSMRWGNGSIQMTGFDIPDLTLLFDDESISWTLSNGESLACSGRCAWGHRFELEARAQRATYSRYSVGDDRSFAQVKLVIAPDGIEAAYEYAPNTHYATHQYHASIGWAPNDPHLTLRHRIDSAKERYARDVYALDYRPGRLQITKTNRTVLIESGTPKNAAHLPLNVIVTGGPVPLCWHVDSYFPYGEFNLTVTGEDAFTLELYNDTFRLTEEELKHVDMLNVHELLALLDLLPPEAPVSSEPAPAVSPVPASQPTALPNP